MGYLGGYRRGYAHAFAGVGRAFADWARDYRELAGL
jgi:hypothetical protein